MTADARWRSWGHRIRARLDELPLRTRGLAVIALPIAMLLLAALSAVILELQERRLDAAVRAAYQAQRNVFVAYVALLNAETGVRGYLLTGDESFLQPYHLADREAPAAMRRLREDAAAAAHESDVDKLAGLVDRRLAMWRSQIERRGVADLQAELQDSKVIMDDIRQTLTDMLVAETRHIEVQLDERARLLRRNHWFIGATVFGGVGGGLVIGWMFFAGLLRRIAAIEADAVRLAAGEPVDAGPARGDAPGRPRGDALGRLEQQLRSSSVLLREREASLRTALAENRKQLEHAALLNRELEAFSYSVSHDLRAPLRSIDGFAQALAEDCEDALGDTGRDHLRRIRGAAQRMGLLIDDMLMLSRVTRADLRITRVDISVMAGGFAAQVSEGHPERAIDWRIKPGIIVAGDPALLRTALDNLLDNACKFTARTPHAVIAIEPWDDTDQKGFMVWDNGAGFDPRYAGKLFGVFQRLHSAAEFPGTGVGLAIVQRVAAKHGGSVRAEGAQGQGAAFFVSLPDRLGEEDA